MPRKKYDTPHRSRVVKTRMTEEEYADFAARLAPYGISQSEFIRRAIQGASIRPVVTVSPVIDSTGDLIEVSADPAVFGGQLSNRGKQLVIDRGNRDNGTDACALNGSAEKLGLADAVGRKAGGKVGVFFLGQ